MEEVLRIWSIARRVGARLDRGAVRLQAERMDDFLHLAEAENTAPPSIECLYLWDVGTRPSMELSAEERDFNTRAVYFEFARKAAASALTRAAEEKATAVFELGCFSPNEEAQALSSD